MSKIEKIKKHISNVFFPPSNFNFLQIFQLDVKNWRYIRNKEYFEQTSVYFINCISKCQFLDGSLLCKN